MLGGGEGRCQDSEKKTADSAIFQCHVFRCEIQEAVSTGVGSVGGGCVLPLPVVKENLLTQQYSSVTSSDVRYKKP